MIFAYPHTPSVRAGADLTLHVWRDQPGFYRVRIFAVVPLNPPPGRALDLSARSYGLRQMNGFDAGWYPTGPVAAVDPRLPDGSDEAKAKADRVAGYDASAPFRIPSEWPSGPYVAVFDECDSTDGPVTLGPDTDVYAPNGQTLIVVRPADGAPTRPILYKLSTNTYNAYNATGGWSWYMAPPLVCAVQRPGAGTGGHVKADNTQPPYVDPFDPRVPRNTFAWLDAPFIAWLAEHGYLVDFCSDYDLHQDSSLLAPYRLLLSVGHDEYWSETMKANATAFRDAGGNIAFLSGNTCYRVVAFFDDGSAPTVMRWLVDDVGNGEVFHYSADPDNALTGVSFVDGARADDIAQRGFLGYRVQHADSWVYQDTGFTDWTGDATQAASILGSEDGLIGYEADSAVIKDPAAIPVEADAGMFGTPASLQVLGYCPLPNAWFDWQGSSAVGKAATMGVYQQGGTVFSAGTVDWIRAVAQRNPVVEQITQNVLDRLAGLAPLTTDAAPAATAIRDRVVVFATGDGDNRLYANHAEYAQGFVGWSLVQGGGWPYFLTGAAPAAAAIRDSVVVFARGNDDKLYVDHADYGEDYVGWTAVQGGFLPDFTTDAAAATTLRDSVVVVAKDRDTGALYVNHADYGQGFVGWQDVQEGAVPGFVTDVAPAATTSGDRAVVFATRKDDGRVYVNSAAYGQGFVGWTQVPGGDNPDFVTDAAPAAASVRDSVLVFAKDKGNGGLYVNADYGQGFVGWTEVPGGFVTDRAPGATTLRDSVVVFARDSDTGEVYVNHADYAQDFVGWTPVQGIVTR